VTDQQLQLLQLAVELALVVGALVVANLGDRDPNWRPIGLASGFVLAGLVALLALADLFALAAGAAGTIPGVRPTPRLWAGALVQLLGAALGAWVMIPGVRRWLGHWLKGFRTDSVINAVGACLYILVLAYFVSAQVSVDQLQALSQSNDSPSLVFLVGTNQAPMLIVAFVGVGLFVRRSWRETLERLGLTWPKWRWLAASLAVAVGLILMGVLFDQLMNFFTPQQSSQIQKVSNQLLRNVNNLPSVIALGVAAGVGEETLFRGALLPRLGNVAAALLFAVLHAQYAFSFATLEIFVLGLILGFLRPRAGTTGCIVAHATYDIIIGVLSLIH
jgi:membrane protease YdiL (CAAX protease family)